MGHGRWDVKMKRRIRRRIFAQESCNNSQEESLTLLQQHTLDEIQPAHRVLIVRFRLHNNFFQRTLFMDRICDAQNPRQPFGLGFGLLFERSAAQRTFHIQTCCLRF